jgi:hypothetical protein
MSEGTYNGSITITDSNAANSPQSVDVTLTVSKKPPPEIGVSPTSLTFSGKEGGSNPSSQSIRIRNNGEEALNYSIADDANWLSVSPTSGSSTGQEITHTVSVNINGMSEGTYNGTITINSSNAINSPQKVGVTLTLSKQTPPEISVTPSSLTFSGKEGGSSPSSQNIRVKNTGEGTLNYSISDDADWLSVSPDSGTSTGGENSHTVSVNISGIGEGSYTGTISISDSNASNSPQTVSVALTISKDLPPEILVSPTSLSFSAEEGGSNPSSQSIGIRNSGQQTLNYTISDDAAWLSVSPGSGSSTGGENSHAVSVDISGLSSGTHNGTITITDSNASNDPQTVSVTLIIETLPSDNEISVSCSPNSGSPGATITVTIAIDGNISDISSFGLDLTYDSNVLDFQDFSVSGTLTESWGSGVAANEASDGLVKVGGYGGTNSILKGSQGTLIEIYLTVIDCSSCSNGQQSQICIENFTDDIAGMTTAPGCVTFTYNQ